MCIYIFVYKALHRNQNKLVHLLLDCGLYCVLYDNLYGKHLQKILLVFANQEIVFLCCTEK